MARYFLRFRHSDTGLTPTFSFFKKASDLSNQVSPPIGEVSGGTYYFDYSPSFDVVFEADGGASIPTEEVRYISDTVSPKDLYVDEPTSQVFNDVWNDTANRAVGTKGDFVEHVGVDTDAVNAATIFGQVYKARDVVMGGTGFGGTGVDVKTVNDNLGTANTSLTDIKGAGFVTGTDSLKIISDNVDAINIETDAASIANAVWDATTAGNITPGTMGGLVDGAAAGTAPSAATVAAAVWNEATSGHVTAGTFGQTLQLEDSGLAQAGAGSTVTLRAGASAITDFYKNGLITITSGTGVEQSRSITAYDGTTKIATVDRPWGTQPISGSGYMVLPAAPSSSLTNSGIAAAVWDEATTSHVLSGSFGQTLALLNYGTATAGAASTITLAAGASAITDFYKNALLVITGGTGAGQARSVSGYVGGTKVATVDRAWGTNPDATSLYMILPSASTAVDPAGIADAVWDEAISGHLTAGSTGDKLYTHGVSAGDIADAVWDETLASHLGAGSTGARLNTIAKFTAQGDTVAPTIIQVASLKHTQVRITFSEAVVMTTDPNGALNISNYSIPGITVIAVAALTSQQVMLTTSAQTPLFLYSLSVTGVEDTQGNPIV